MTVKPEVASPRVRRAGRAILVLGVTLELIAGAGVGAFVGAVASSPDGLGAPKEIVMGVAMVFAIAASFAVVDVRGRVREAERDLADPLAPASAASVEALRESADRDHEHILEEVRALRSGVVTADVVSGLASEVRELRAEVARLGRPFWKRVF